MEIPHHLTYMHATKNIYFRILNLKNNFLKYYIVTTQSIQEE